MGAIGKTLTIEVQGEVIYNYDTSPWYLRAYFAFRDWKEDPWRENRKTVSLAWKNSRWNLGDFAPVGLRVYRESTMHWDYLVVGNYRRWKTTYHEMTFDLRFIRITFRAPVWERVEAPYYGWWLVRTENTSRQEYVQHLGTEPPFVLEPSPPEGFVAPNGI